jgi:polyphosphate kinase
VFIGSADLMHRNLDRRVESLVRLVNPRDIRELCAIVDLAMDESTASWHLDADGDWQRHQPRRDRKAAARPAEAPDRRDPWPGRAAALRKAAAGPGRDLGVVTA